MNRNRPPHLLSTVAAAATGLLCLPAPAAAPSATIRVDLAAEGAPVPAGLYGIFMEEINHGFDGGIHAELIRNRAFEEGLVPPGMKLVKNADGSLRMELEQLPPGVPAEKHDMPWPWNGNCGWDPGRELLAWSLHPEAGATGSMKLTAANPLNPARQRSLEVTVDATGAGGRVALANEGYWGINVREGGHYDLCFHLRPGSFRGGVTAALERADGTVLASHDFGAVVPGSKWRWLTATLRAGGSDPRARFTLSFRGAGTLQVAWVSLFPETWQGRPGCLRPDLAQLLADYRPDFIRYPGGCHAQGLSWESAPDWRRMVKPPVERPGMWGYWKYRSTDGFGYHEFLEFCEQLGADAMYVAFCGMTVHPENNMPLDQLGPVIQQTLDAIEYALGPVDSQWGAVRARMGHPEPFPLKYVEIGNEHPPAVYGDYYVKFREAIKARYPQVTVVMSMFWSGLNTAAIERAGDANIDVVDEHAYRPGGWARTNWDYFDGYPPKPWKVYLGEYASHHGNGDWSAAMDDSLFLMMMERNGDRVTMASYAPLLCNVNARQWGVNLIEYDASRSFAHASYYVQKTFNEQRPDVNLASSWSVEPAPDPERPLLAGRVGLGGWNTAVEFRDLRIEGPDGTVLLRDDFADLARWETPGIGRWEAAGGVLRQTDPGPSPAMLLLRDFRLERGRVTVKARRTDGREGFLVFFNAAGPERFLFANCGAAGNTFTAIQDRGTDEGTAFRGGRSTEGPIGNGRWYELSLVVGRDRAELLLDGAPVADCGAEAMPSLFATAGYHRADRAVVVKATNYHPVPVTATIVLDGARTVSPTGRHIVIQGAGLTDENSLDEPRRIVPAERPLERCGPRFEVTLPPWSVNVLRVPATKQVPGGAAARKRQPRQHSLPRLGPRPRGSQPGGIGQGGGGEGGEGRGVGGPTAS